MEIAIIGVGYVGLAVGLIFGEMGHQITFYDCDKEKLKSLDQGIIPFFEPGMSELLKKLLALGRVKTAFDAKNAYRHKAMIAVCVGTPSTESGATNLQSYWSVIHEAAAFANQNFIMLIKSTVPIGTGDRTALYLQEHAHVKAAVVNNPEFLSQGSALKDMRQADRIIIGTVDEQAAALMKDFYAPLAVPLLFTDCKGAELIKYGSNGFLAVKLSYINEIANLCMRYGTDTNLVAEGIGMDHRIGHDYMKAGCGYGGSCLPKDTHSLISQASIKGYEMKSLMAADAVNEEQKFILLKQARSRLNGLSKKRIAVLGITFKVDTDDLRCSPALSNIEIMILEGAEVAVYDPRAAGKIKKIYPMIHVCASIEEALTAADACFIFTEWESICQLKRKHFAHTMKQVLVYDERHCLNKHEFAFDELFTIG